VPPKDKCSFYIGIERSKAAEPYPELILIYGARFSFRDLLTLICPSTAAELDYIINLKFQELILFFPSLSSGIILV